MQICTIIWPSESINSIDLAEITQAGRLTTKEPNPHKSNKCGRVVICISLLTKRVLVKTGYKT